MSYGSDYLREALTLNERKVNKKSLKESIKKPVGNDFIIDFTGWVDGTTNKHYYLKGLDEDGISELTSNLNKAKGFNSFDEAAEFAMEYVIASGEELPPIYPRKDANKHGVQTTK